VDFIDTPSSTEEAIGALAEAIIDASRHLGSGNASTGGWGAIESGSKIISDSLDGISSSLGAVARAIEGLSEKVQQS
jgi:hypothetical protein